MSAATVVGVYASALVEAAEEAGRLASVVEEVDELVIVLAAHPALIDRIEHPDLSRARAKRLLSDIFESRISRLVFNLLRVLVDRNRFAEVVGILRHVRELADQHSGQLAVAVTSAVAIDATAVNGLRKTLARRFDATIELQLSVDPELIGGMRVQVQDRVIDATVSRQLNDMKRRLQAVPLAAGLWDDNTGESA
jgi:F-type H+-transporting ATPase subunit delta